MIDSIMFLLLLLFVLVLIMQIIRHILMDSESVRMIMEMQKSVLIVKYGSVLMSMLRLLYVLMKI